MLETDELDGASRKGNKDPGVKKREALKMETRELKKSSICQGEGTAEKWKEVGIAVMDWDERS